MQTGAKPSLIGVDWGTSSLRGYLFSPRGEIIDRVDSAQGIQTIAGGEFRSVFEKCFASWLAAEPAMPVIACGMIGSQQGWREARYVQCPASLQNLGQTLTRIDELAGRPFAIVPGLKVTGANAHHDVMRGEETQILGLDRILDHNKSKHNESIYVMPGSHSKWVRAAADEVRDFRSFLTGELYAAIAEHTIVGRLLPAVEPAFDEQAFAAGLQRIRESPESLTAHLFSIRAQGLLGVQAANALPSYLSGLLIGSELCSALTEFSPVGPVILVGSNSLMQRYQFALSLYGHRSTLADPDAAAHGLFILARQSGLLRPSPTL